MYKNILFRCGLSVLLISLFLNVSATIHVIQVANFQFTPASLNVSVGDTVRWTWVSGSHTTTSATVPNGAATWDSQINSSNNQFDYKVTVAGTYGYVCTPHAGSGMVGTFNASSVTGIQNINEADISTSIYPNPFNNELFIDLGNENPEYTQIIISDILGKQVRKTDIKDLPVVSGRRNVDVAELQKGIYFATLKGNGTKTKTVRLVKEGN